MKNKFKKILIAAIVQLVMVVAMCAVTYFAISTESLVLNPLTILVPVIVGLSIIDFIALIFIYRK